MGSDVRLTSELDLDEAKTKDLLYRMNNLVPVARIVQAHSHASSLVP